MEANAIVMTDMVLTITNDALLAVYDVVIFALIVSVGIVVPLLEGVTGVELDGNC